jgi:hypothetical protein
MEKAMDGKERRKNNRFQWFLLIVLIPLLFAIIVTLLVSTVAGVNVFESAREYGGKVPVIGNLLIKDDKVAVDKFEKDRIDLEAQV